MAKVLLVIMLIFAGGCATHRIIDPLQKRLEIGWRAPSKGRAVRSYTILFGETADNLQYSHQVDIRDLRSSQLADGAIAHLYSIPVAIAEDPKYVVVEWEDGVGTRVRSEPYKVSMSP